MIKGIIKKLITEKQKLLLKSKYNKIRISVINTFFSYNSDMLKNKLREMGIKETDTLLVHSNFNPDSGFKGAPIDVVNALIDLVGAKGNLLMVSIPFRGTTYDYLTTNKPFNIKKTMSMMGFITEIFRRREGVLRSFHPTHPVLAYGKDSKWLISEHEKCLNLCGVGSPFDKFRQLKGKILFFDVGFGAITFFHYVEDIIKDKLPFNVYSDELFSITAYDENNNKHIIKTYAYNKDIIRDAKKVEEEMLRRDLIKKDRVGNSSLLLMNAEDVVACQTAMIEAGNLPYKYTGSDIRRNDG
ncbi:MAG: AAC(3) family N-acetyltransferase [Nitrospirota bacterium]